MAGSQDGRIVAFISRLLGWLASNLPSSLEFGIVDPHPMQNYAHPTCQSDRRPFRPTPTNDEPNKNHNGGRRHEPFTQFDSYSHSL